MILIELLKYLGINIYDNSTPPEVIYALCIMLLSIMSVICFFNLLIYFIVLFALDSKYIQDKIDGFKKLQKIINLYKNTRIYFILFEVLLFIWLNGIIILTSYKIVSSYYLKS